MKGFKFDSFFYLSDVPESIELAMKLCKSILSFSQDLSPWDIIKLHTRNKKDSKYKSQAKLWGGGVQLFDANPRHSLAFPSSPRKHTGLIIHQDMFPLCYLYTAMLVELFDVFGRCFPHQATKAQIKGTKAKPLWGGWVHLFDWIWIIAFPSSPRKHTGLSEHPYISSWIFAA